MIKLAAVVDELVAGWKPLEPGEYEGVVHEIREAKVADGAFKGQPALQVAVQMADKRLIWKILPMLTAKQYKAASPNLQKWYSMSYGSFVRATGWSKEIPEDFRGTPITVVIDFHKNSEENAIVLFKKSAS